ncbi:hypothetical protein U472_10300 [Orenia metallireducens]|uniref:Metallo-beta-lactamase domain-containing protein n=1 Tax=Orenia metallireducens TaxID=1413210 RepID=A0A1C0A913_9FIRM|nr:hypothetical protein U472_10300 [Orenia metallireducens]
MDAGVKNKSKNLIRALDKLNADISEIKLIIITHVHYDHVGSLNDIQKKSQAPVLVHKSEEKLLALGATEFPKGTAVFSKAISKFANRFLRSQGEFRNVKADIIIEDSFKLSDYGVEGEIIHTPGHTEGSLSIIIDNKYCIVGDSLFNLFPNNLYPPFANDEEELLKSWRRIKEYQCQTYYPGHGRSFTREEFESSFIKVTNR